MVARAKQISTCKQTGHTQACYFYDPLHVVKTLDCRTYGMGQFALKRKWTAYRLFCPVCIALGENTATS